MVEKNEEKLEKNKRKAPKFLGLTIHTTVHTQGDNIFCVDSFARAGKYTR